MTRPTLTLADLADELEAHVRSSRRRPYEELDVFADDVAEIRQLREGTQPASLQPLGSDGRMFAYERKDQTYTVELSEHGVVRLAAGRGEPKGWDSVQKEGLRTLVKEAISTAKHKKGEGWAAGLVLGLLVGAVIGSASPPSRPRRRVLTVRFDPGSRRWSAYDGGLVGWLKEELQPTG